MVAYPLEISICRWLLDYLTGRPQTEISNPYSSTLSTGVPQGFCLRPSDLNRLFTCDFTDKYNYNMIVNFADDNIVTCLISTNNERGERGKWKLFPCGVKVQGVHPVIIQMPPSFLH